MRLGGRVQRGFRRAMIAFGGTATTKMVMEWAYPHGPGRTRRERQHRSRAVCRVGDAVAERADRVWPDGIVWRLTSEISSATED
jgi:hypothetical protein